MTGTRLPTSTIARNNEKRDNSENSNNSNNRE